MTDLAPSMSPPPGLINSAPGLPNGMPKMGNFNAAVEALKLTPQEQALYGRHLGNVKGAGGVDNADGSRSTIYSTIVEMDGKAYVLPTVWQGKIVSPEAAIRLAGMEGLDKFPSYASVEEAQARYDAMHAFMERDRP